MVESDGSQSSDHRVAHSKLNSVAERRDERNSPEVAYEKGLVPQLFITIPGRKIIRPHSHRR